MKNLVCILLIACLFSCENDTKTMSSDYDTDTVNETKTVLQNFQNLT